MLIHSLDLPGTPRIASGKVREIFDLGGHLLFVATDRISAFDCILPNPIPRKGAVLTSISAFWFRRFGFVENHIIATDALRRTPRAVDSDSEVDLMILNLTYVGGLGCVVL